MIVEFGMSSALIAVARSQGIAIKELVSRVNEEAGVFSLRASPVASTAQRRESGPREIALILHTSGTSAKPKIIPFTHANLLHSAHNIRASLELTAADRCLNLMPLFHGHGIIAGILSSISAGASAICPPGFYAPRFFSWVKEFRPTWYTAVPTMHQAILARAPRNREVIDECPLRFIRSGSAALAPQALQELERTFQAPVIEAYATTETVLISSNPLPPRTRKPGSVGIVAGMEVQIRGEDGNLLPPGETGDIVVRGANVMRGYEDDPRANQEAFLENGWFKTGDRGRFDSEGYLFITGSAKEVINRGGEKVSPREIEEVLLDHPAVEQAVTFALADANLGEGVGAAVVLSDQARVTESELGEFVARKLADFKVPRRIIFVREIPKGSTGKPQRIGLASKLGITGTAAPSDTGASAYAPPRNPTETQLCAVFSEVLGVPTVGIHDDFFLLGGDSLLASSMLSRVGKLFGSEMSLRSVFDSPTVEQIATKIHQKSPDGAERE
jgi:acyl-CoA synthetase (AMP-forming)/AMP-acid ligase II